MNPFAASVRVLGLYLKASVLIFIWQVVLYSAGFAVAGLPLWALLSLLCAGFGLIPRIGSLIGIALVLLIAWISGTDLLHLAITGGVWVVVQAVEGFWLTPRLLGKPLGLRPLAVFVAMIVASFVFGPIGLLLAVPVLAIAMVWYRYFQGRPVLPGAVSKEPIPPAPPAFPSRLSGGRSVTPTTGIRPSTDKSPES